MDYKNKTVVHDFLAEAYTQGDTSMQEIADILTDIIRDTDMQAELIDCITDNAKEQAEDFYEDTTEDKLKKNEELKKLTEAGTDIVNYDMIINDLNN